jgi:hypothetical protein
VRSVLQGSIVLVAQSGLMPVRNVLRLWPPSPKRRNANGSSATAVRGPEPHNAQKHPTRKPNAVELHTQKFREMERAIDHANEVLDKLEQRVAHYDVQIQLVRKARAERRMCVTARSDPGQTVGSESGSCQRLLPGILSGRVSERRPGRQLVSAPGRIHPPETGSGQDHHQVRVRARRGLSHSGRAFDPESGA